MRTDSIALIIATTLSAIRLGGALTPIDRTDATSTRSALPVFGAALVANAIPTRRTERSLLRVGLAATIVEALLARRSVRSRAGPVARRPVALIAFWSLLHHAMNPMTAAPSPTAT